MFSVPNALTKPHGVRLPFQIFKCFFFLFVFVYFLLRKRKENFHFYTENEQTSKLLNKNIKIQQRKQQ